MPIKRKEKPQAKEWIVPMRFVGLGSAFVTAVTAEEAAEKAESGDYIESEIDETNDWEVDGEPKLNE
jgi:hypothetical protein